MNNRPQKEKTLRSWLQAQPFTLGMSSGFFGFFAHAGLVSVLEEEKLFPASVCGSSAGALVGGLWAAGVGADKIKDELLSLKRKDFWDPWLGFGFLRGKLFKKKIEALLPVDDFADCRFKLTVSVFDLFSFSSRVLDKGSLANAIHAACALPILFQPVWVSKRPCLDGGVADRQGICGVKDKERLFYHHLASKSPWRKKNSKALQLPK